MSDTTLPAAARRNPWLVTGWLLAAIGAGSAANAVLALLARAANAPADFRPLQPSSYVFFTAVGVVVGALGWAAVLKLSKNPQVLLKRLVPPVVAVSFVPDFFLFDKGGAAGVTALLLMHVAVAVVAVMAYRRAMPLRAR